MLQFYFLSIVLNIITGLILIHGHNYMDPENVDGTLDNHESLFFNQQNFRLVLLILGALVGLLKLVATVHIKDDFSVFGDLLCVLAGIMGSVSLFIEYNFAKTGEELNLPGFVEAVFVDNRKIIGYFCICVALLHFIFPRVMFL